MALETTVSFDDFPAEHFAGPVVRPGDPGWADARRLPNARRGHLDPGIIVRATSPADVAVAVSYCNARDIPVAIRSGGHGIDGFAMPEDAFVIDLSLMKAISVDPDAQTARIEAGVLLREMDAATQEHGLVVPAGTVSETGAAGLILGGGMGYNTRRFGMSVDHLLEVEVVTADGTSVVANERENSELFWGLRGCGHNLGVATAFTLRCQPVGPDIYSGLIIYDVEQAVPILSEIDDFLATAPLEMCVYPVVLPAPPLPGLPEQMIGVPIFVLIAVYTGPLDAAPAEVERVAALGRPLANMVGPSTWMQANSILDVLAPPGRRQQARGGYLGALTPELAQMVVDRVRSAPAPTGPGPSCAVAFPCLGGRSNEFDEDYVAYSRSGAQWLWECLGQWDGAENDAEYDAWVDGTMHAFNERWSLKNGYINLSTDQGPEWLAGLYGSQSKWERLRRIKADWDPKNLFRYNKNVPGWVDDPGQP